MSDNFRQSTSDERLRQYDSYSHAVTTIEEVHRLTHDGFVFNQTGKVAALADAATYVVLISVPAGTYPHFNRATYNFGKGDVDVVSRKDVVTSADGTPLGAAPNTNDNSTNVAATILSHTPTITDAGTVIHTGWAVPSSAGQGQSGATGMAGITAGEEWVLAPETKYSMSITNNSGEEIAFSYDILFYEIGYES